MNCSTRRKTIVIATMIFVSSTTFAMAKEVTFKFAPPDGTKCLVYTERTKTRITEGEDPETDVSATVERRAYKTTKDGYQILIEGAEDAANTKVPDDPFMAVLANLKITYDLNSNGEITHIGGLDNLDEDIRKTTPPEVYEGVSKFVNKEALIFKIEQEWGGMISSFSGATMELDEPYYSTEPMTLPSGVELTYYTVTKATEEKTDDCDKCVRISTMASTDSSSLSDLIGNSLNSMAKLSEDEKFNISDVKVNNKIDYVVDPNTMLVYSEYKKQEITMSIHNSKEGGRGGGTIIKKITYIYE